MEDNKFKSIVLTFIGIISGLWILSLLPRVIRSIYASIYNFVHRKEIEEAEKQRRERERKQFEDMVNIWDIKSNEKSEVSE